VERTTHLLGTGLGAEWLDVVIMQEGLVLTTSSGKEFRTRARRVNSVGVNLSMVQSLADMTREVWAGKLDRAGVRACLVELDTKPSNYSRFFVAAMVGLACAAFCRISGGNWRECVVTWLSASTAAAMRHELTRKHLNHLLVVMLTGFIAGFIPCLVYRAGWLESAEKSMAASALLLVPGVPLINAARDVLRGYVVAGTARGFQGLIVSLCISLGLGTALALTGLELHRAQASELNSSWLYIASDAGWSGMASLGFAVLFNVPKRALGICFVVGATGHALRTTAQAAQVSIILSTLLAAICVGLLAEVFARLYRSPAGIVALPAAIPLVPGVLAFRSMSALLNLTSPRFTDAQFPELLMDAVRNFTTTGLILASLAVGIALPSLMLKQKQVGV